MADSQVIPFNPSPSANFQFQATLDGAVYNCICRWNVFDQRYYLWIYDLTQTLVLLRPVTGSPDTANISLTAGYFDTTVIYRDSRAVFEIPGQTPLPLITRPPAPPTPAPPPPSANYAQELAADSPLVWWRMNDASGSTVGADSGSLGLPFALTGSNDAFGGPALWQQGGSLVCGGSDYNAAIAAHNDALNFPGAGFTFTVLLNWDGTAQSCTIAGHGQTNVNWANWDFSIAPGGQVSLYLSYANSESARVNFESSESISSGLVYRIAARWNSSTGEVGLWVNEDRVVTGSFDHSLWLSTSPIGVGTFPYATGGDTSNGQFHGKLSELAIYDYPLTDARLFAQYSALG